MAFIIVLVMSIIVGIVSGFWSIPQIMIQLQDPQVQRVLADLNVDPEVFLGMGTVVLVAISAILTPIINVIIWLIFSALNAFVVNKFFEGRTTTSQIRRVFGFAYIFSIISVIPCVGYAMIVVSAVTNIIGISAAAEVDTAKGVLTWLVSLAIIFVVLGLLCCTPIFVLSFLGVASGQ
jgi:hypothetical protein